MPRGRGDSRTSKSGNLFGSTRMRAPAVLAVLLIPALLAGCSTGPDPAPPADPLTPPTGMPGEDPDAALIGTLSFNGERAFALTEAQVIRPDGTVRYRIPGTEGNAEVRTWLVEELGRLGLDAREDPFTARFNCRDTVLTNVVTTAPATPHLLLAAHFDSRPIADKDPDPARRGEPIQGANDGAAAVAVVLELVNVLQGRLHNLSLAVAFFDAEDAGRYGDADDKGWCTEWILGSTHHASTLSEATLAAMRAMILVDMPGDANLTLMREGFSALDPHRRLQDHVWRTARDLGYGGYFVDETVSPITDDHVPFSECALVLDVIHLDTPRGDPFPSTHHTVADDIDHVDPTSLEVVGRTLEYSILRLDRANTIGTWERPTGECRV